MSASLWAAEPHPAVWQMVSTVAGTLDDRWDAFDLLHATFPSGSVTGAPKLRAREVIRALEPERQAEEHPERGVPAGAPDAVAALLRAVADLLDGGRER